METTTPVFRRLVFVFISMISALTSCLAADEKAPTGQPAAPSAAPAAPLTEAQRLAWFHEAKFGLFIHWGLYSIPAGEWKGKTVPGLGEWIMHNAEIPVKEYQELARQFDPKHFDADAIAQFAQDVGMKYVVITAKHHDGFALFHSQASSYNAVDATPFKRDIVKELSQACARHGLRFGVYYSQAQDWHEPNGAGNLWDFGPDDKKDFDQYLRSKAEPQVRELLSNYGPICLIWFDTPHMMTPERGQRFADIVRTLQPACLIDGRLGTEGDYTSTGDNAIPHRPMAGAWETPATVNHTWGFRKDDVDWKSPGDIVFKLMDIVSKGGNYLLNVGPTADGVIPKECRNNLLAVGRWLKVNGEAVYGAGPSPFGAEFGDDAEHERNDRSGPVFLERTDWRCTTKPGKLYFTLFTFPRATDAEGSQYTAFRLPDFKSPIKKVYALADPGRTNLPVATLDGARVVKLPRSPIDPMATVVCVEIEGDKVAQ